MPRKNINLLNPTPAELRQLARDESTYLGNMPNDINELVIPLVPELNLPMPEIKVLMYTWPQNGGLPNLDNSSYGQGVIYQKFPTQVADKAFMTSLITSVGLDRFKTISSSYTRGMDAVVIPFDLYPGRQDVNKQRYLKDELTFLKKVCQGFPQDLPIVIALVDSEPGCNCDFKLDSQAVKTGFAEMDVSLVDLSEWQQLTSDESKRIFFRHIHSLVFEPKSLAKIYPELEPKQATEQKQQRATLLSSMSCFFNRACDAASSFLSGGSSEPKP
jgi:hypothetical protein